MQAVLTKCFQIKKLSNLRDAHSHEYKLLRTGYKIPHGIIVGITDLPREFKHRAKQERDRERAAKALTNMQRNPNRVGEVYEDEEEDSDDFEEDNDVSA
jgi:hypothetical protein